MHFKKLFSFSVSLTALIALAVPAASADSTPQSEQGRGERPEVKWWKGNLHTHTLWSDGDDFPEIAVDWYKENGYNFLALSDHNILNEGQKWVPAEKRSVAAALPRYLERFGEAWVEVREVDEELWEKLLPLPGTGLTSHGFEARRPPDDQFQTGAKIVRLKPLSEFRHLFEEAGRFLMIRSEEITAARGVHVNASNVVEFIAPRGGETTVEVMQSNVDAVHEQRHHTGQAMIPHVAHPNFGWAITGEELAAVKRMQFFEVYNGHFAVNNSGDEHRVGLERMWDIVLTLRLAEKGLGVVYAVAVDDTHNYSAGSNPRSAGPGRGWVMVQAPFLTPEQIIHAMEAGDFYSSTGVVVDDVRFDGDRIDIAIQPENGVSYRTVFIGTRRGYDASSTGVIGPEGDEWEVTRRYSDEVGEVLAEAAGINPSYTLRGDEIYVRATVISDKPKPVLLRSSPDEEFEVAWLQPVVPGS